MITAVRQAPLLPYMAPVEWSQLLAIVESVQPRRMLEWGSGGSTRTILASCPYLDHLVSIEHDPAWHARVLDEVRDRRLELHLVRAPVAPPPPGRSRRAREALKAWNEAAEHDTAAWRKYAELPLCLGVRFDLVLVDGRARRACLEVGWEVLAHGGVLVLHDAQRVLYHDALRRLGRVVFLEPWAQGQIALVRKA